MMFVKKKKTRNSGVHFPSESAFTFPRNQRSLSLGISVHFPSESAFTFPRNQRSLSLGISVHFPSESAFTFPRNQRSLSLGISVHFPSESAFTFPRNQRSLSAEICSGSDGENLDGELQVEVDCSSPLFTRTEPLPSGTHPEGRITTGNNYWGCDGSREYYHADGTFTGRLSIPI